MDLVLASGGSFFESVLAWGLVFWTWLWGPGLVFGLGFGGKAGFWTSFFGGWELVFKPRFGVRSFALYLTGSFLDLVLVSGGFLDIVLASAGSFLCLSSFLGSFIESVLAWGLVFEPGFGGRPGVLELILACGSFLDLVLVSRPRFWISFWRPRLGFWTFVLASGGSFFDLVLASGLVFWASFWRPGTHF